MASLHENMLVILEHLKSRKGWNMRDVAEQAFFLSPEEKERFYRWMMRAKDGKITERHGASAMHERTLRWLIHSEESLFNEETDLSRFDLIDEVLKQPRKLLDQGKDGLDPQVNGASQSPVALSVRLLDLIRKRPVLSKGIEEQIKKWEAEAEAEKGNSLSQWVRRKPESEIKRGSEVYLTDRKLRIYNDVMDDYLMLIKPDEAKTKEIKNAVRAAVAKLSNNPFIHELEAVAKDISERYPEDILFDLPQSKNYKRDEKWDTSITADW